MQQDFCVMSSSQTACLDRKPELSNCNIFLTNKRHVRATTKNKVASYKPTCVIKCNKHIEFMFHIFLLRCLLSYPKPPSPSPRSKHRQEISHERGRFRYARGKLLTLQHLHRFKRALTPTLCHHSCYFYSCCCSHRMVQKRIRRPKHGRGERIFPHYLCARALRAVRGKKEQRITSFYVQHR